MKRFIVLVFALVVVGASSNAFSATRTFSCEFETYSSPEGVTGAKGFTLGFMIDTITKKAILVGNNGFSDVLYIRGSYGITFLEKLKSGAVQSTTIALKTGQAVHSRHSLLGTKIVPSQYYGACKVRVSDTPSGR